MLGNKIVNATNIGKVIIDDDIKIMITSAINTINKLDAWNILKNYEPEDGMSTYMFSNNNTIQNILNEIQKDYGQHNSFTMAFTCKEIEYIAKKGEESYINMLKKID